jgi:hypothetical protein
LSLEWNGDELFDLFGRKTWDLGGDLGSNIAKLRVGFDRQRLPGIDAKSGQQHGQHDDRYPPAQAEADELVNH